jgi:hypothetical protein
MSKTLLAKISNVDLNIVAYKHIFTSSTTEMHIPAQDAWRHLFTKVVNFFILHLTLKRSKVARAIRLAGFVSLL